MRQNWVTASARFLVLLFNLLFISVRLYGQGSVTASITGTIVDVSGGVIPGVKVVLRNTQTNRTRSTETSNLGTYEFVSVPIGPYELSAEKSGFSKAVTNVQLTVQSTTVANLTLKVGNTAEAIEVSGVVEVLNTANATLSGLVNNEKVTELPLNGRSFVDLVALQPGATPIITTGGGRVSPTRDNGGFINGADSFYNDFTIDGGDFNDNVVPGSLINKALIGSGVPPDAIAEFRVITSDAGAEFGTVGGAHINVVTKSGTNSLHGALWEFLRNSAVDSRNFFDPQQTPPFKYNQFGGVVGGPIRRDKSFFFGSYEGYRQRQLTTLTPVVPTPLLLNALPSGPAVGHLQELFKTVYPAPNPGFSPAALVAPFTSSVRTANDRNSFIVRDDTYLTAKDALYGRIIFNNATGTPGVILSSGIPGGNLGFGWRTINPLIGYTHTFSLPTINEVRFNYNRSRLSVNWDEPPNAVTQFGYSLSAADRNGLPFVVPSGTGLSNLGVFTGIPQGRVADVYQLSDALTLVRGRHTVKFGGNILRYQDNNFGADTPRPQTVFIGFGPPFDNSSSGLTTGSFFQQTQTFNINPLDSSHRYIRYSLFAVFAQDTFRVQRNLTLDYGLRYEIYDNPSEKFGVQNNLFQLDSSGNPIANEQVRDITHVALLTTDRISFARLNKLNFAPRIGLAWTPFSSKRFVVRTGYGIFHQRPDLFAYAAGTANPPFSIPTNLVGATFGTVANPSVFVNLPKNVTVENPGNQTTYLQNYNLSLQFEVDKNSFFQVSYVGTHTVRYNINDNPNMGGAFRGARPNPAFGLITLVTNVGNAHYNSMQVEFNRRLAAGLSLQVSYTYGKYFGIVESGAVPTDLKDFNVDRGPMDADLRHMFVTNFLYDLPWGPGRNMLTSGPLSRILGGWSISGVLIAHAGQPFSIVAGPDVNGFGNNTGRARLISGQSLDSIKADGSDKVQFLKPQSQVLSIVLSPTTGTPLSRNDVYGPRFFNLDFGLLKDIPVNERLRFQFRSEFFNLFNHTNLSNPINTLTSPVFGRSFSTVSNARQIQFGLKLYF